MSLNNNFKEIHFWQTETNYSKIDEKADKLYCIQNYIVGFVDEFLVIYDNDYNLVTKNIWLKKQVKNIYVSQYKNKVLIQSVYAGYSTLSFYNIDFTLLHETNVNTENQVIYVWNDMLCYITFGDYTFSIIDLDGKIYTQYNLPLPIISFSNIVFDNHSIYTLAKLINDRYIFIRFDEDLVHTDMFSVDIDNIKTISIDYFQEFAKLVIINENSFVVIQKLMKELFIHPIIGQSVSTIPKSTFPFQTNFNKITDLECLLNNDVYRKNIDLTRLKESNVLKRTTPKTDLNIQIINTAQVESAKFIDYFQWILENYNNNDFETVLFFDKKVYPVTITYIDRVLRFNLDLETMSNSANNYMMTWGRLQLNTQKLSIRNLQRLHNVPLSIPSICGENESDYYSDYKKMTVDEMKLFIHFMILCDIQYSKYLYWTPFQYYKIDMRYIWRKPLSYWKKIFDILDKNPNYENLLPYIFYNIINE